MVKDKTVTVRVALPLKESQEKLAEKNNMSLIKASMEINKLMKEAQNKNKKFTNDIEF